MLPIASLNAETARALEGLCFDVDDTLTRDGVLEASAYTALFRLRASGLTLIAVTGRPLGWAELIARMWPVHAAVGENGAGFIAREGSTLRFGYWDDESARALQATKLAQLRARVAREMPHVRVSNDSWARRCDLAFDVNEYERLPREDIDRLCDILASEGAHTSVSSVHAHAQLGSHDKALGAARALHELFDVEETRTRERFLFVGDSGNDAAAFAWFQTTAGVSNVSKHLDRLPCPPRYVASQSHGAGFAEIAEVILQRRQP